MSLHSSSNANVVKTLNKWFSDAQKQSAAWRREAKESYDFYAGDQWAEEDIAYLKEHNRPVITFNRVAAVMDSLSGSERANRQEVRYLPREISDGQVNEMFSAAAKWIRDETDAEDEESEAFLDAGITGMGWTETWLDFQDELDGKIIIDRVPPMEMYWDPDSKKRNLADARYVCRIKIMAKRDIKAKWPKKSIGFTSDIGFAPKIVEDPHDADEAKFYRNDQAGRKLERDEAAVAQFQWWEPVPIVRFFNPKSNETENLTSSEFEALQSNGVVDDLEQTFPDKFVPPLRQTRRQYFQAFIVGRTLLEKEQLHPMENDAIPGFTLRPITGKRDETNGYWYGVMRAMKDPQRWSNKFFSLILEIIQTNAKGGLMAEEGAFVNQRKAEEDWASPDSIVWLQAGALSGDKPRAVPKPASPFPAGLDKLLAFSISSTRETAGFNLESLGLNSRTQAGVVESSRVKQSMLTQSILFDSLRLYRKQQGRVLLHFIQKYLPDRKLFRIAGEERFVEFRKVPDTVRFDTVVDQAPSSPTMKEEAWAGLQQILPALIKAGLPIPPDVIDFSPLPQSVINKIKKFYASQKPSPEQQQMRQKSQQLGVQQQEADVKETLSLAEKNLATARSNDKARQLDREKATVDSFQDNERLKLEAAKLANAASASNDQSLMKVAELILGAMTEGDNDSGG
jgi:hypothetical protein